MVGWLWVVRQEEGWFVALSLATLTHVDNTIWIFQFVNASSLKRLSTGFVGLFVKKVHKKSVKNKRVACYEVTTSDRWALPVHALLSVDGHCYPRVQKAISIVREGVGGSVCKMRSKNEATSRRYTASEVVLRRVTRKIFSRFTRHPLKRDNAFFPENEIALCAYTDALERCSSGIVTQTDSVQSSSLYCDSQCTLSWMDVYYWQVISCTRVLINFVNHYFIGTN